MATPGDDVLDLYGDGVGDTHEEELQKLYASAERTFNTLSHDIHLPFLESKLYTKYFISVKTEQRLDALYRVIDAMSEHKKLTLKTLKLIHERESIMNTIRTRAKDFSQGRLSTLEAQTLVLQLLYAHQQATMKILESITAWRSKLTRAYSFPWKGQNYIVKIREDCEFLDRCDFHSILPLRVSQFPLCSNITSLHLFATTSMTYPLKANAKNAPMNPETASRMKSGEVMIFEEHKLQQDLMRELSAIAASSHFVPILDLHDLVPNCRTGIRLSNQDWDRRLHTALEEAREAVDASFSQQSSPAKQRNQHASSAEPSPNKYASDTSPEETSYEVSPAKGAAAAEAETESEVEPSPQKAADGRASPSSASSEGGN